MGSDKEKEEEPREKREEGGVTVKMGEARPRDFQIRKEDAERLGYTRGCAGCTSWFKGLAKQSHNNKCRERFREEMKGELKGEESARAEGRVRKEG